MYTKLYNVNINCISCAIPQNEIKIEDELEYYENSYKKAERAKKMIGIDKRRVVSSGQTASDLCASAAQRLFEVYPEAKQADALIFVTQSPDYDLPATACILQHKLGLPQDCASFDVNQGCAGYIYGLWLAASAVASGSCNTVLLLVGDASTRPRNRQNRIVAPIFGDGGSATLISRKKDSPPLFFSLYTDVKDFSNIIIPAGAARLPFSTDHEKNRELVENIIAEDGTPWRLFDVYMDGKSVFDFTLNVVPDHILNFLNCCSIKTEELDQIILHQANRQIINSIAEKSGLPKEKTPSQSFSKYGNLSSASIPAELCETFGTLGALSNKKLLLSGFGVGLAWGSCLWQPTDCMCLPIVEVPSPSVTPKESTIEFWKNYVRKKEHETD